MATVTIQIAAGAQTAGRVRTVQNGDLADFILALRDAFPVSGEDARTDTEMVTLWADHVLISAQTLTKRWRRRQQEAALVTPEIEFS